jgi:hypothetical protein
MPTWRVGAKLVEHVSEYQIVARRARTLRRWRPRVLAELELVTPVQEPGAGVS